MSRRRYTLGTLFKVKHGFAFKSRYFDGDGQLVLMTPGHFREEGGFRDQGEKTKYYSGDVPNGYVLDKDDLVVVMTEQMPGLLGSSVLVPESGRFLHNQRLGRVVDLDCGLLDKRYLYYLFNTRGVRAQISASASGTKVRHTSPGRIRDVTVELPAVSVQRKVARMLALYDELIDNNARRTKLLEHASRLLYDEWFVRLRFPGYEHVPLRDGAPDGWKRKSLGDVTDIAKGKNITRDSANAGDVPVVAGGMGPAYFHDTANARGPVITISASGANAGFVNLYHVDIWASDCSYISAEATEYSYYIFLLLKSRQREILGLQRGAAQPHVYPKDLARLPILLPRTKIIELFEATVTPHFQLIRNLLKQNELLSRARDMLLPLLMSGEVAV